MSLIDRLFLRSQMAGDASGNGPKRVLARVLLDDRGHVQAVELRRSCGYPEIDAQAIEELRNMHYPGTRLGSKTSRRWHNIVWTREA